MSLWWFQVTEDINVCQLTDYVLISRVKNLSVTDLFREMQIQSELKVVFVCFWRAFQINLLPFKVLFCFYTIKRFPENGSQVDKQHLKRYFMNSVDWFWVKRWHNVTNKNMIKINSETSDLRGDLMPNSDPTKKLFHKTNNSCRWIFFLEDDVSFES